MSWNLASAGRTVVVNLDASGNGALTGVLTYNGTQYPVTGAWAAAGSIAGRNASAFSLSGRTQTPQDIPDFIAASGVMIGSGDAPQSIEIRLGVSSSSTGSLIHDDAVLTPTPPAAANYAVELSGAIGLFSDVNPTNAIGTSDFTLETWIQPSGVGPIASFGYGDITELGGLMTLEIVERGAVNFSVSGVNDGVAVDDWRRLSVPTPILDGEWHHIAAVRTGADLSLYLDGEPLVLENVVRSAAPIANLRAPYKFAIGSAFVGHGVLRNPSSFLKANYDEMRLWKVALTRRQIADGMHHQLTDRESGLVGHWTFDQTLNDSSAAKQHLRQGDGTLSFITSPIDFEPGGEAYLVTQAQLMQDWVSDPAKRGAFEEISGYRVIVSSRDADGNPLQANIRLSLASPQDRARLVFADGTSEELSAGNLAMRTTSVLGELSFVIDSLGQLSCPPLKAWASFMDIGHSLVISPDRHVHATLAGITGPQLAGEQPLKSGKTVALNTRNKPTSQQLDAVAQAVSQAMSAALDHGVQPERPQTRDARMPEDTPLPIPHVPRYQRLETTPEPYHFPSNVTAAYFLAQDFAITRILIAENMPNAQWMLDYSKGVFQVGAQPTATGKVQYADPLAALFQGRTAVRAPAAAYLSALIAADAAVQKRGLGDFWEAVKSAASVFVETVETTIVETVVAIKTVLVTAIDAAGNAVQGVLHTIEDAIGFVGALFAKLGAEIEDVIDFVKAVFDWDDIRRTAGVIESLFRHTPEALGLMLQDARTQVDDAILKFQAYLDKQLDDDIKALGPASANGKSAGAKAAPPSDIQSRYVGSLFAANAQNASDPSGAMNIKANPGLSSLWSSKFNDTTMQGVSSALASQPAIFNSPDSLLDSVFADVLAALKSALDALLTLLRSAVDAVFEMAADAISALFAIAQARIEIPLLTDFYEQVVMGGQGEFSLLGVVSLMGAMGFNVAYKLITRRTEQVFSDALSQEMKAPGFLVNAYKASPVRRALTGQPDLPPSIARTAAGGPDALQIAQWIMGYAYAATTVVWGVAATMEDVEAIKLVAPEPAGAPINVVTKVKMVGQTLTLFTNFPVFSVPENSSTTMILIALGMYGGGLSQFASNVKAAQDPKWSFFGDPLFTGTFGALQLAGSIAYGVKGGGALAGIADGLGAFEWIPQLGKLWPAAKWLVPIVDAVAYGGVAVVTMVATGMDIAAKSDAQPAAS